MTPSDSDHNHSSLAQVHVRPNSDCAYGPVVAVWPVQSVHHSRVLSTPTHLVEGGDRYDVEGIQAEETPHRPVQVPCEQRTGDSHSYQRRPFQGSVCRPRLFPARLQVIRRDLQTGLYFTLSNPQLGTGPSYEDQVSTASVH